jgi:hypothetical protein
MQGPGGPWEDPTRGIKFGGWVMAPRSRAVRERLFYGAMTVAILVTVFIGFAPT